MALNGDLATSVADQMKAGSDTADIGYKMYEAADEQVSDQSSLPFCPLLHPPLFYINSLVTMVILSLFLQKMIAGTAELSVQICNESGCSFKPDKEKKKHEHAR